MANATNDSLAKAVKLDCGHNLSSTAQGHLRDGKTCCDDCYAMLQVQDTGLTDCVRALDADDSLARAIEYLGAVEVAPGRYAVQSIHKTAWFTTGGNGVIACANPDESLDETGTRYQRMPPWWTPEQRFAWRMTCDGVHTGARDASERFTAWPSEHIACSERITAGLTAGEEIPA